MEKKVERFISDNNLFDKSDSIGVAVSGGADSMVLLFLLKKIGFDVTALHFEHGIRGKESLSDAAFVEEYCKKNSIACVIEHGDIPGYSRENGCSIETAARLLRYDFLQGSGFNVVATAHHSDDNVETVLQHIIRGTGIKGLTGIPVKNDKIVRPFLCVTRAEIEEYALKNRIPFVTDSTNTDSRYSRNRVRAELVPLLKKLNPDVGSAVLRLSGHACSVLKMIEKEAGDIKVEFGNGRASVCRDDLLNAPEPVSQYVLYKMFCHIGQKIDIESGHIQEIMALSRTGAEKHIKNGCYAKFEYGNIIISKKDNASKSGFCVPFSGSAVYPGGRVESLENTKFRISSDRDEEFFSHIPDGAVIRTRLTGDLFHPMGGKMKKLKDYMIDMKIPAEDRDSVPLLAKGNEIIWVIGYNMSADYMVKDEGEYIGLRNIKD